MFERIHPRIRIALVLISSFFISGVLFNYSTSSTDTAPPSFELQRLSDDFSQSIIDNKMSLLSSLSLIQLPSFQNSRLPNNEATQRDIIIPTHGWSNIPSPVVPTDSIVTSLPTDIPGLPTSTPAQVFPTDAPLSTVPHRLPTTPPRTPTKPPLATAAPKPTKVPKPTRVPRPTAIVFPPINTDQRPGTSIGEIFSEAGKRACVPSALLMAIKTIETGERFKNESAASLKIYNTYGWWKSGAGNPCYGYGYHTQTGIVPADSVNAGTRCSNAVGSPTDIGIMGLMQVSQEEETVTRKYTIKFLSKNIDRRVLFDNVLIFAIATKNRVGNEPMPSCDDWPEETVKMAAEKHHGVCVYDYGTGNAGNYCTKVWDLYKSFR